MGGAAEFGFDASCGVGISICAGLVMEPGREPWSQFDCRCRLLVVLLISIAMKAGANQVREGYDRQHADLRSAPAPRDRSEKEKAV